MHSYRPGWSLRHALCPQDEAARDAALRATRCPACDRTDTVPDLGALYHRGMLLFHEVLCTCTCGFCHRLFVVVNDIRRRVTPLITDAADAMARAVRNDLVPDPRLDEGFAHLMLAHHQGDFKRAGALGEALIALAPANSHAWFNLGWCYAAGGRWLEALAAFRKTRELEPAYREAVFHESRMWYRLGAMDQGRAEAAQYSTLDTEHPLPAPVCDAEATGLYGTLRLTRDPDLMHLHIDAQDQGALYLDPPAMRLVPDLLGPGPFSPHFRTNALLTVGIYAPAGTVLMLGLGLGAGPAVLLHHFPDLRITAVEADPAVVDAAFRHVPLLDHFRAQGRLTVVTQAADAFLAADTRTYDAAVVDLYQGHNTQPHIQPGFLQAVGARAPHLWLNLVTKTDDAYLGEVLGNLAACDRPAAFATASVSPRAWPTMDANWIVATAPLDPDAAAAFLPTAVCEGEARDVLHAQWRMLQQWYMGPKDIAAYLASGALPVFPP